jgi:hypothetical protein
MVTSPDASKTCRLVIVGPDLMRLLWRDHRTPERKAQRASTPDGDAEGAQWVPESRWPMGGAVIAVITMTMLLPDSVRLGPVWLLPLLEGFLLVALAISDPGKITRTSTAIRALSIGLVLLLAIGALASTGFLIEQLVSGGTITNEAEPLLSAGVTVWTANGLAFALLFWELDGRGPANRARAMPVYPDFAFPQQLASRLAPSNWRPPRRVGHG